MPGLPVPMLGTTHADTFNGPVPLTRHLTADECASDYELTDYGRDLEPVMHELGMWGARSLGPPSAGPPLFEGWLGNALDCAMAPMAPPGRFEFRVGDEVASMIDGEVQDGPIDDPDVVVEADPDGIYWMFVERRSDHVRVEGDRALLDELVRAAPSALATPTAG